MAPGLCPGAGGGDQGDAEAAEPVHLESNFVRAEGSGGGAEGLATVRGGDAAGIHPAPGPGGSGVKGNSGGSLPTAGRRVLRVSQYFRVFWTRRLAECGRRGRATAA